MKKYILLSITLSLILCSQSIIAQTADTDYFLNIFSPYNESIPSSEISGAQFGGTIDGSLSGELMYGLNMIDTFGCQDVNMMLGKIALVDRGECNFNEKAFNVEGAGAIACIICNTSDDVINMAEATPLGVTIPTIMLKASDCANLKDALNNGFTVGVGLSAEAEALSKISGNVANDENSNCINESTETDLSNFKITVEQDGFIRTTFSDEMGNYSVFVDTGNHVIQVIPPSEIWINCADPVNVYFPEFQLEEVVDFPMQSLITCPALTVDIASPLLRRCFDNNYYINYCNLGSANAAAAYVDVTLDPLLTIVSSSIPFTQSNNIYTFNVGDVNYGDCAGFNFQANLSCDAELGMTFCAITQIFPDDGCALPIVDWDGVDIALLGNCGNDQVDFTIQNNGEDMTSPLSYRVIRNAELWEEGTFILNASAVQNLNFPSDGATYRVEATQSENHPWNNLPSKTIEACSSNGDFDTGFFTLFPVADYGDTYDELCQEVIGAFDPNDKQGFPRGFGDENFIYQNVDLRYLIRFQNTGTDTAFTVRIEDEISEHLDINTFRPTGSSHDYRVDFEDRNLIFTFDNILLPDSFVNEPASNGYIEFEISQNKDVALTTVIENTAGIFFDFNEPVITNTTTHTVGDDFLPVDIIEISNNQQPLTLSPNPVKSGQSFVIAGDFDQYQDANYDIYSIDGEWKGSGVLRNKTVNLNNNIQAGIYIIKILDQDVEVGVGKFVIY